MNPVVSTHRKRSPERGIALVLVLLILATTTVIGIGAVTASISDLRITGNENCYNKLLNTADVGIQTARLDLQALQGRGDRKNTTNNAYTTSPLTFWNLKNCGNLDAAPQASDSDAKCSSATTADGIVQSASSVGGRFQYFYEIRLLSRESKQALIAGEQIGNTQSHQYVTHSLAEGCGTTANLESRTQRAFRMIGPSENDYLSVPYDPKSAA
ncbi:MAG: PilX N-terminal domain-containing pilus assembly protein [bacterium]